MCHRTGGSHHPCGPPRGCMMPSGDPPSVLSSPAQRTLLRADPIRCRLPMRLQENASAEIILSL